MASFVEWGVKYNTHILDENKDKIYDVEFQLNPEDPITPYFIDFGDNSDKCNDMMSNGEADKYFNNHFAMEIDGENQFLPFMTEEQKENLENDGVCTGTGFTYISITAQKDGYNTVTLDADEEGGQIVSYSYKYEIFDDKQLECDEKYEEPIEPDDSVVPMEEATPQETDWYWKFGLNIYLSAITYDGQYSNPLYYDFNINSGTNQNTIFAQAFNGNYIHFGNSYFWSGKTNTYPQDIQIHGNNINNTHFYNWEIAPNHTLSSETFSIVINGYGDFLVENCFASSTTLEYSPSLYNYTSPYDKYCSFAVFITSSYTEFVSATTPYTTIKTTGHPNTFKVVIYDELEHLPMAKYNVCMGYTTAYTGNEGYVNLVSSADTYWYGMPCFITRLGCKGESFIVKPNTPYSAYTKTNHEVASITRTRKIFSMFDDTSFLTTHANTNDNGLSFTLDNLDESLICGYTVGNYAKCSNLPHGNICLLLSNIRQYLIPNTPQDNSPYFLDEAIMIPNPQHNCYTIQQQYDTQISYGTTYTDIPITSITLSANTTYIVGFPKIWLTSIDTTPQQLDFDHIILNMYPHLHLQQYEFYPKNHTIQSNSGNTQLNCYLIDDKPYFVTYNDFVIGRTKFNAEIQPTPLLVSPQAYTLTLDLKINIFHITNTNTYITINPQDVFLMPLPQDLERWLVPCDTTLPWYDGPVV